jgi:streptogramin lyase
LANSVTVNYSGTQGLYGNTVGVCTTRAYGAYTTQAYTYFRVVVTSIFSGGSDGGMEYTEWTPFFVAGQTSSSNFGSTWVPTIQTGDAFNVTKNVTVVSAGTGFATLPAFTPLSTGLSFSARVTINSGTPGQWARVFDAGSSYPTPLHSIMMYFTSANRIGVNMERNNVQNIITSTTILVVGTEYHVSWVITSSGISKLYINAIEEASGTQPINIQNYYSFFIGKSNWTADPYGNITVRDFRMFNRSLSASEVTSLYQNLNYGSSTNSILSLSKSGQYSLAGDGLVARIDNNYLTTYSTNAFSVRTPPNINAPIVDTAVSQTGQYMVLVTAGVTNNVYYSRDYGATFTALTLGSSAMVSCSISHDGSYLTVSNGTTVYRLNSNSTGYSLALGSQAGQINQALNAIAVGSQAGQRNQSANSVVLNASGTAVNTGSDGFYVAPIASSASAATTNIGLLGYGEDKQVVQTTVTVLAGSGNVGIGTTNPQYQLQLTGAAYFPVDAIQQAPFLSPSPANAPLIKAWMNEIVITSSPVTGLSPFWSSALSYSTIAGAPGNYAYNGGVLLPDGRVVFVPYNATTIGLYNPATHAYSTIAAGAPGNAAYAGGVLLPDGRVVFVPSNATTIGLFNPTTNTYSTIAAGAPGTLAYFGGYLLSDGRVLFAPRRATTIGFFNPSNNTYSTLSGLPGNDAYIGGVLLPDGRVVFVPFSGSTIGLFDPITNTYSTVSISSVSAAYIGGVLLPDGRVVFIPFTSSVIGIFDPATNIFRTVSGLIGGAYYCGTLLPDGRVLFIPYSSSVFGLFNPTTNSFTTLSGAPGVDAYSAGVLLPDGRVVLVPLLSSVIGIFHQSIPASPEMCLHPFFNKF